MPEPACGCGDHLACQDARDGLGYTSVPARSGAKGADTAEDAGKDGSTGLEPPATPYEPKEIAAPPAGGPAG
ncbi:hypothetical protein [Actinacidiphila glaucinigra]|uniref:hypothetical protein n=1 Tax=Actinacidiphila glaucinigra TaxID=235986 RepID=UPI003671ABBE